MGTPDTYRIIGLDSDAPMIEFWGGVAVVPVDVAKALADGEKPGRIYRLDENALRGSRYLLWRGGKVKLPAEVVDEIEGTDGAEAKAKRQLVLERTKYVLALASIPNAPGYEHVPPEKMCSCGLRIPPVSSLMWPGIHTPDCRWVETVPHALRGQWWWEHKRNEGRRLSM